MIKISLKGLAKYIAASPAQQRNVLRNFKYPDPEGFAQATYYKEARDFIITYHKRNVGRAWLTLRALQMDQMAALLSGQTKARYSNNARALRDYIQHFAGRKLDVREEIRLSYNHADVVITVVPDLHVIERKRERIIKLEFTKEEPSERVVKVVSQLLFEAQSQSQMGLTSSSVLYWDVRRGTEHKGARAGARMRNDIEAACETISDVWRRL